MKALKILLEMQYAYDTTGIPDMIGLKEAIEELELLCDSKYLHKLIDERIEELSGNQPIVDNHTCEGCKWYEVRNHSASCNWCERHPSRQIRNINIKDYWESK